MRVKPPTENFEHMRLVAYLERQQMLGNIEMFSHIASESRSKSQNIRNKRMGLKPGLPDFIVLKGRTLFIELKRLRGGRVSPEQHEWIEALNAAGSPAAVCKGFQEAKEWLEQYDRQ